MKVSKSPFVFQVWKDNKDKFDFVHNHSGFECDVCGFIPDVIYCTWLKDQTGKHYLRLLCLNDFNKLKKDHYLKNYIDLISEQALNSFPDLEKYSDIIFIAKHFLLREIYDSQR